MATKGFEIFKKTGIPMSQIRKEGLDLSGEYVPLESVVQGRFRGAFSKCYQYKVISSEGEHYECAIPELKPGEGEVCKESLRYRNSEVPSYAYGNWI